MPSPIEPQRFDKVRQNLVDKIRTIPDWPKEGISFKDLSPLYADVVHIRQIKDILFLDTLHQCNRPHFVVGPEARGFIGGSLLAYALPCGFVPARKKGKLPPEVHSHEYALEYGTDTIELPKDVIPEGSDVLIYDDLCATGGTAAATASLLDDMGCQVVGFTFLVDLTYVPKTVDLEETFEAPVSCSLVLNS